MTRVLGIDLGNFSIKIAELELSRNLREVVGLYELPRVPGEPIDKLLLNFFTQSGVQAERIAVGLGRAPVFIKNVELPFSDKIRVNAAVRADLEDSLPFEITDQVIDVSFVGRKQKLFVFRVGLTPIEPVKFLNQTFEKIGKNPSGYFLESEALGQMALYQQLPQASLDGTTSYGLIDVGFERTQMAICAGAIKDPWKGRTKKDSETQVLDFRSIDHGMKDVISWIEKTKSIAFEDAKQWLSHRATIKPSSETQSSLTDQMSEEIKTAFRGIVVEIYQFLQHHKASNPNSPLTAIYLTGGMSHIAGLKEFFSEEFHFPVFSWPIFLGFKTEKVPLTEDRERTFAAALSLGFRFAQKNPVGWLNFRRSPQSQRNILTGSLDKIFEVELRKPLLGLLSFLVFVLAYTFGASFFLNKQLATAQKNLINEFKRVDRELGKRAEKFALDPGRAREIYLSESKKRSNNTIAAADPGLTSNEVFGRPRTQIVSDLSTALIGFKDLKLDFIDIESTGSDKQPLINVKAQLTPQDPENPTSAPTETELNLKLGSIPGYSPIKISPLGKSLVLTYKWAEQNKLKVEKNPDKKEGAKE